MAINPNISLGVEGIKLPDVMGQYVNALAIRNAQTQNQMNQMQMQRAQREIEVTNAMNRAYAENYDPQTGEVNWGKVRGSIAASGFGSELPGIDKRMMEMQTAKLTQQKGQADLDKSESDLLDSRIKQVRNQWGRVRTPEDALRLTEAIHNDPVIGKRFTEMGASKQSDIAEIMNAATDPEKFRQFVMQEQVGIDEFLKMNKPQIATSDLGDKSITRTIEPITGKVRVVDERSKGMAPGEAARIRNEGLRIGLEGRRVAVAEENARRDADPAFQQRLGVARATGEAMAKGDVAAMQMLPKVITRAEEGARLIEEMIGKRDVKTGALLKGSKPHPGFQNAVGATWAPGLRFVPGTDAAGFMARFDQIKGASFLEAFESLRGGGSITQVEGEKGTSAINRMSIATDEKEFIRAALDLQDVIRTGVKNAQSRAARAGGVQTNASSPNGVKFLGFE